MSHLHYFAGNFDRISRLRSRKLVLIILSVFLLPATEVFSQQTDTVHIVRKSSVDSLQKGMISGEVRLMEMVTVNKGELKDFSAQGISLFLKYETRSFKGFSAQAGGSLTVDLFSKGITIPDPEAKLAGRYESQMFDLSSPKHTIIPRAEELYLKYSGKHFEIRAGKQFLRTSFINPQDGRLRPTLSEGLVFTNLPTSSFRWTAGWLYKISPRGTSQWYGIGRSMGVYAQGLNVYGSRGDYFNNTRSGSIFLAEGKMPISSHFEITAGDVFVSNVFNTLLVQPQLSIPVGAYKIVFAGQYIHQDAVHLGGNPDSSKAYFLPGNKSNVYGLRLSLKSAPSTLSGNYTRITSRGQYLMPREWGIEPFFTFIARERNEGSGDVDAVTVTYKRILIKDRLSADIAYGRYWLPPIENYRLNKYSMPSYEHYKVGGTYEFSNQVALSAVAVLKYNKSRKPLPLRSVFNRVGVFNGSLAFAWSF